MDALLLMVPLARANCHTGFGDFHMDPSGRVSRRRAGRVAPFVFTGVELVSKRLFDNPPEGAFSMNLLWDRAIEAGRCYGIRSEEHTSELQSLMRISYAVFCLKK